MTTAVYTQTEWTEIESRADRSTEYRRWLSRVTTKDDARRYFVARGERLDI